MLVNFSFLPFNKIYFLLKNCLKWQIAKGLHHCFIPGLFWITVIWHNTKNRVSFPPSFEPTVIWQHKMFYQNLILFKNYLKWQKEKVRTVVFYQISFELVLFNIKPKIIFTFHQVFNQQLFVNQKFSLRQLFSTRFLLKQSHLT